MTSIGLWGAVSRICVAAQVAWDLYGLMNAQQRDHANVLLGQYKVNALVIMQSMDRAVLPDDILNQMSDPD